MFFIFLEAKIKVLTDLVSCERPSSFWFANGHLSVASHGGGMGKGSGLFLF